MSFTQIMELVSRGFEVVAIAVLVAGFAWGALVALRARLAGHEKESYLVLRRYFGLHRSCSASRSSWRPT